MQEAQSSLTNRTSKASQQQRWLMVLRLCISTFLLLSLYLLKNHGESGEINYNWFVVGLAALGLYYILAVLFYYLPGQGGEKGFHKGAQIAADLALGICLTMVSGGADSPFVFLFIIVVINGAFLGSIRHALLAATFSSIVWGALVVLQYGGVLDIWLSAAISPKQPQIAKALSSGSLLVRILINTGSCYLVAFLSGYLAGQLFLSRTALVKSQAHLDRLEDLNESIIQSIDSGLITMDHNGLILTVNRAGLDLMGWQIQDVIGRPWQMYLPQLEHILPLSPRGRATIFDTGGLRFDYLRESDGRELILELNVLALVDKNGEIWGRLFVLKDLTSLSHMEDAVRKAEHLAALGELAAGLAHELRTPLASMTGAWHMLAQQTLGPEDQQRLISIIGREMERLAKLTNDFLSFARPARGNAKPFNLSQLVADQLKVFEHSHNRNHVVVNSNLAQTPEVYFDQDQLSQIIWNLFSNALEACEKNAEIIITVETGLDINWPGHVILKVGDNGPGIPHENLSKIFEPFFTTKTTGNGLGLPIVSRILHEGHGNITVASSYRGGTNFTVMVPLADNFQRD